ncbi:MAG: phospholipase [Sporichthyaceae bacterium]|nr:phospholipase [Sporichthyaceae bacterium]
MSDWFLPRVERPWSSGNLVIPQLHGVAYFARLAEVVRGAGQGDQVFFTDWRGDADQLLAAEGPSIGELICDAARRGVQVRGLLWRSHSDRMSFSAQENQKLGAEINDAGGEVLLDQRVRLGGSHHQKMVVVRHRDRPDADLAFVGGIDLCHSRRDDSAHAGDPQTQPMDIRYGRRPPWHDAMLEIHGPAVLDVLATFIQRWNDPTPLDHRNPYRMLLQRAARMPRHATPLPEIVTSAAPAGPHLVQVLRTYPRKRPPFPFATQGERTIARAYERAFRRATRLVYVEDQYLWSDIVARTLAEALRRAPRLQVIAVVPRFPDQDGRISGPPNRLGQLAAMGLLTEAGGNRFAVYDLENEVGTPVYVHAKVCIIDDAWMTCGSDNFNRRSWTHDSELTCAVIDPDGLLPRRLRTVLWSEHLGLPLDDKQLADIDGAGELWRERTKSTASRARPHRPARVSRAARIWATPMYRLAYDPDGRPRRQQRRDVF